MDWLTHYFPDLGHAATGWVDRQLPSVLSNNDSQKQQIPALPGPLSIFPNQLNCVLVSLLSIPQIDRNTRSCKQNNSIFCLWNFLIYLTSQNKAIYETNKLRRWLSSVILDKQISNADQIQKQLRRKPPVPNNSLSKLNSDLEKLAMGQQQHHHHLIAQENQLIYLKKKKKKPVLFYRMLFTFTLFQVNRWKLLHGMKP